MSNKATAVGGGDEEQEVNERMDIDDNNFGK